MEGNRPKRTGISVGDRVGRLTVVARTRERRYGYAVWRCRCDCGGDILLDTRFLQRGAVRDCGCGCAGVAPYVKDLTGERFGLLVCIAPTRERGPDGGVVWRCRCDCGRECTAVSTQLSKGYKRSCGCLSHPPRKDYVGRRFGSLTVTAYLGRRDGQHYWRCRCDCGADTDVSQTNLQSGHTRSCGCLQRRILQDNLKLVDGTSVTLIESRLKGTIRSNTSGYNGVYFNKKTGKWIAQITFKGKTYYLGSYTEIQDAAKARHRGEEMYENFLDWYYGARKVED